MCVCVGGGGGRSGCKKENKTDELLNTSRQKRELVEEDLQRVK